MLYLRKNINLCSRATIMHLKMFFLNGEKKMHINLWRGIQEDPRDPPSYAAAPGCRAAPPVAAPCRARAAGSGTWRGPPPSAHRRAGPGERPPVVTARSTARRWLLRRGPASAASAHEPCFRRECPTRQRPCSRGGVVAVVLHLAAVAIQPSVVVGCCVGQPQDSRVQGPG